MVTENLSEPIQSQHPSSTSTSLTTLDNKTDEGQSTTETSTASTPPAQKQPTSSLRHHGPWFKDDTGRTLLLRGVNVCGSSKLPTRPYAGSTHLYDESFWDHTKVSFVNRPFPLDEAKCHFARLKSWGFTLIRLLVPWEALEHEERGVYDEEYITYLVALIELMADYQIQCFIDPHQDTFSRFTGGSGAPGWTLEMAGLNMKAFKETGAAYVHNTNAVPGDPLPMVWPTNYTKLACCTMFTLFWAGDVFAPNHTFNGQSIQQLLQSSFINAFKHLAERLQHLKNVVGFEVMNEPHPGYVGLETLKEFDPIVNLIFGDAPTPLQSFALGDGIPQKVGVYIKSWPFPTKKSHSRVINASQTSAWLDDQSCIWKQHGVWGLKDNNKPVLLKSDYFAKDPATGEKVDFYKDFYVPFVNKYARTIQSVNSSLYCFVEPLANEKSPVFGKDDHHHNMIFAPHWYDLNCVFYKKFDGKMTHDVQALQNGGNVITATYFGQKGVKKNYSRQIKNIKKSGLDNMGITPALFGEVGIPMDINDRYAFRTGDYTHQTRFMDAVIHSLEENLVNFTLWNYDANNDHEYGDHWNGENFSIFSPNPSPPTVSSENLATMDSLDNTINLNEGGRVLGASLRPYAAKIAGVPEKSSFKMDQLSYTLIFRPFDDRQRQELASLGFDVDAMTNTTEIYVPNYHYQDLDLDIQASHGECQHIPEKQMLYHRFDHAPGSTESQLITITLKPRQAMVDKASCSLM